MTKKKKREAEDAEEKPHRGPHLVPHATSEDKKDLQRKYMQLQMLRQYAQALTEEHANIERQLTEMAITAAALEKLDKIEPGEEMMSSLGNDCYVKADIKDTDKVIVGIGSSVYLRKSVVDARKIISSRQDDILKAQRKIMEELNVIANQIAKLEPEVARMAQAAK